jgi:hypothetical protein
MLNYSTTSHVILLLYGFGIWLRVVTLKPIRPYHCSKPTLKGIGVHNLRGEGGELGKLKTLTYGSK